MVLMSASKMARHQASIVNLPNCGGVKKQGLTPTIGHYITSNPKMIRGKNTQLFQMCDNIGTRHPTQRRGYSATHSGNMG